MVMCDLCGCAAAALLVSKRSIRFVYWCSTGFKLGINHQLLTKVLSVSERQSSGLNVYNTYTNGALKMPDTRCQW